MTRRGPHQDALKSDEGSGVTKMAPMPVKTLRLSELDESDRTAYFSVTALMERGKAVAARVYSPATPPAAAGAPPAPEAPSAADEPPIAPLPLKPSVVQQFREASLPRKATVVMLPLLIGMLLLKPVFKKPSEVEGVPAATGTTQEALVPQHVAEPEPTRAPLLAATPAEPPPVLPKGLSLERAASDALAAGDFERALGLYRELSRRQPQSAAYGEAVHILERRLRERQP
ncbi:MAG: hypothetical protein EOO73_19720 [Myxococcales bacterium]|nr:MAG: hypothetical protein EOO73_19720 [Myxococcales bacterium]